MLFARSIDVWKGKGVLVETAFTNFMKMYEVCDLHAARENHKDAIAVCDDFIERMSGKRDSVLIQLREARETIQNNRKKLCPITAIVVGRTLLSVVIVIVALIWKVYKQQAQTMATFVLCSTFVSRLETLS